MVRISDRAVDGDTQRVVQCRRETRQWYREETRHNTEETRDNISEEIFRPFVRAMYSRHMHILKLVAVCTNF